MKSERKKKRHSIAENFKQYLVALMGHRSDLTVLQYILLLFIALL